MTSLEEDVEHLSEVVSRLTRSKDGLDSFARELETLRTAQGTLYQRADEAAAAAAEMVKKEDAQERWSRDRLLLGLVVLALVGVVAVFGWSVHTQSDQLKNQERQRLTTLTTALSNCTRQNQALDVERDFISAQTNRTQTPAETANFLSKFPANSDCSAYQTTITQLKKDLS